jgi:hypothetical protein
MSAGSPSPAAQVPCQVSKHADSKLRASSPLPASMGYRTYRQAGAFWSCREGVLERGQVLAHHGGRTLEDRKTLVDEGPADQDLLGGADVGQRAVDADVVVRNPRSRYSAAA